MEGEGIIGIRVVPHLNAWSLLAERYAVEIQTPEPPELGPFDPPDAYVLRRELEKDPAEPVQLRIVGGRLDLREYVETIEEARSRGQGIEFHVYED